LGIEKDSKCVNLGTFCTSKEQQAFIRLFKKYLDVFTWMYNELKTYDIGINQHVIPVKEWAKPFQQKVRKVHPTLEPIIQKELTKLLDAQII